MAGLSQDARYGEASPVLGYRCFGFSIASTLRFPGAWPPASPARDATVLLDAPLKPASAEMVVGWRGLCDGRPFAVVQGSAGEHRFVHGDKALFELSSDLRTLRAASSRRSIEWWRVLLDSVLFTVGLLHGKEALHAGCVAGPAGAVAICAPSGAGKSTLVAELLRHGHELVADDILFVEPTEDGLLAHPGPPLVTVPTGLDFACGHPVGQIGNETWTAVAAVAAALPLRRIVLLNRSPGANTALEPMQQPLSALLPALLSFPASPARQAARFELAADLVSHVEVVRLSADTSVSPRRLAQMVTSGLM